VRERERERERVVVVVSSGPFLKTFPCKDFSRKKNILLLLVKSKTA
jgi:hypothetical protein